MSPPAPPLSSTMTGWPNRFPSASASARAVRSGEDPAGKPTIRCSGLLGQLSPAMAAQGSRAEARAVAKALAKRRRSGEMALAGMGDVGGAKAAGHKKTAEYPGLA